MNGMINKERRALLGLGNLPNETAVAKLALHCMALEWKLWSEHYGMGKQLDAKELGDEVFCLYGSALSLFVLALNEEMFLHLLKILRKDIYHLVLDQLSCEAGRRNRISLHIH
jgi:hypothetical protein